MKAKKKLMLMLLMIKMMLMIMMIFELIANLTTKQQLCTCITVFLKSSFFLHFFAVKCLIKSTFYGGRK